MRFLFVLAAPCVLLFASCGLSETEQLAALRAEVAAAREEAAAARAELAAIQTAAGKDARRAVAAVESELSKIRAGIEPSPAPAVPQPASEEAEVLAFGKNFVEDLEQNRLTSAYRLTSPEFQKETERKAFNELVEKYPKLNQLENVSHRQEKVRKSADGKEWEYYCTAREFHESQIGGAAPGLGPRVNFSLTIAKDGTTWRVTSLEIAREKTP